MHVGKDAPERPDPIQFVRVQQELLLASTGAVDIDSGPDAFIDQTAVEVELHVAGAFELLKNDLIHAAAGIDQRRRQYCEAAPLFHVAGRPEEALRFLHGIGIKSAAEELAAG